MMSSIYNKITDQIARGKKIFAMLLDPEKCIDTKLETTLKYLKNNVPDLVLIGGSCKSISTEALIARLRVVDVPLVLFPGDVSQFSSSADALLFISLLSGNNVDYLIGQQSKISQAVKASGIETIPTAYILIDGGKISAVERVSNTTPIPAKSVGRAVDLAVAGELLGMKMVYLEAGSGALNPVDSTMISEVKNKLSIPLIVGGGIRSKEQMQQAFDSGADIVVMGNLFEQFPEKIENFITK